MELSSTLRPLRIFGVLEFALIKKVTLKEEENVILYSVEGMREFEDSEADPKAMLEEYFQLGINYDDLWRRWEEDSNFKSKSKRLYGLRGTTKLQS
jgi:hypothetical protein